MKRHQLHVHRRHPSAVRGGGGEVSQTRVDANCASVRRESRGDRSRSSSMRFDASAFDSERRVFASLSTQRLEVEALCVGHGLVAGLPLIGITLQCRLSGIIRSLVLHGAKRS
jgi:hypothetical protein